MLYIFFFHLWLTLNQFKVKTSSKITYLCILSNNSVFVLCAQGTFPAFPNIIKGLNTSLEHTGHSSLKNLSLTTNHKALISIWFKSNLGKRKRLCDISNLQVYFIRIIVMAYFLIYVNCYDSNATIMGLIAFTALYF